MLLSNGFFWLLMLAFTALFAWLTLRAWRTRNSLVKWVGVILGGLVSLGMAAISIVTLIGLVKVYTPGNVPVPDLVVEGTPEQITRGQHLANSFCTSCHSTNGELPLTGGMDLAKDIPIPLGSFVSTNLTPAGPLKDWSDGEIMRALRNGLDRNGRKLAVMSTARVRNMSDEDLKAVIAYLRSQPAIAEPTQEPADRFSLLAIALSGAGLIPEGQPPITGVITAPPKGPTVEYGKYILNYQDCRDCHGEDLTGGKTGQLGPIGPGLQMVKGWTTEEFVATLRTGVDPNGHQLSPTMPWKNIGRMDDHELAAMYAYLVSLP